MNAGGKSRAWSWVAGGCAAVAACACLTVAGAGAAMFLGAALQDAGEPAAQPTPIALATLPPRPTPIEFATLAPKPTAIPRPTVTPAPSFRATTPAGPRGDPDRQRRVLDEAIGWIRLEYVYPDFNGLDLDAERRAVEGRIQAGLSDAAFHAEMRALVGRLNDNHSAYFAPDEVEALEERNSGGAEYVGFGVNVGVSADKRFAFIVQVYPNSPAERAGLRPHEHIVQIDGQPVIDGAGQISAELFLGADGSRARVTARAPGGPTREVIVTRGKVSNSDGVEARMLASQRKIGYVLIETFAERGLIYRTRDAVRGLMDQAGGRLDGLVIDMRNNEGGFLPALEDHLALFTRGRGGSMVTRDGEADELAISPLDIGNSQTVPLVILIGDDTASFGEVFCGVLRFHGRARLVGQATPGVIETLLPFDLEDGSQVYLAREVFRLPDGSTWSRRGLQPDAPIRERWEDVTLEADTAVAEAVRLLER